MYLNIPKVCSVLYTSHESNRRSDGFFHTEKPEGQAREVWIGKRYIMLSDPEPREFELEMRHLHLSMTIS